MDLHEAWKKLETEKLTKPVLGTVEVREQSKHPVEKIIHGFKRGLGFIIAFQAAWIWLLFAMPQTVAKAAMLALIAIYIVFFIINYRVLRRLRAIYHPDQDVYHMLSSVYKITTDAMKFQLKLGWGFFPASAAAGFLLGLSVQSDAAQKMANPWIQLALLITIVVLTPLCFYLTKWMNKKAYGKYWDQIRALLRQMEDEKMK